MNGIDENIIKFEKKKNSCRKNKGREVTVSDGLRGEVLLR